MCLFLKRAPYFYPQKALSAWFLGIGYLNKAFLFLLRKCAPKVHHQNSESNIICVVDDAALLLFLSSIKYFTAEKTSSNPTLGRVFTKCFVKYNGDCAFNLTQAIKICSIGKTDSSSSLLICYVSTTQE